MHQHRDDFDRLPYWEPDQPEPAWMRRFGDRFESGVLWLCAAVIVYVLAHVAAWVIGNL